MRRYLCGLAALLFTCMLTWTDARAETTQMTQAEAIRVAQSRFRADCGETADSQAAYAVTSKLLCYPRKPGKRAWQVTFTRDEVLIYTVVIDAAAGETAATDDPESFYLQRSVIDRAKTEGRGYGIPRAGDLDAKEAADRAKKQLIQRYGLVAEELSLCPSDAICYVVGEEDDPERWRAVLEDGRVIEPPYYFMTFWREADWAQTYGGYFDPVTGEAYDLFSPADAKG